MRTKYHIIPKGVFSATLIKAINTYSNVPESNLFFLRTSVSSSILSDMNDDKISMQQLIQMIPSGSELIVHKLDKGISKVIVANPKDYILSWVFWGTEFYNSAGIDFRLTLKETGKLIGPKYIFSNHSLLSQSQIIRTVDSLYEKYVKNPTNYRLMSQAFNMVDRIYHFNKFDIIKIRDNIKGFNAELIPFRYPFISFDKIATQDNNISSHQDYRILIGHSASPMNNHVESLIDLQDQKNLSLFLPFVYGSQRYASNLKQFLSELHPRFSYSFINKRMDLSRYNQFLKSMDAAVINSVRSIGLGNIYTLLAYNKVVFLRPENPAFSQLKEEGLIIGDSTKISDPSYIESFIHSTSKTENAKMVRRTYSEAAVKKMIRNLF